MSTHFALPRVGHLEQLSHVRYLKEKPKRKIAFDLDNPFIDERRFKKHDRYDFYRDAKEAILGDMSPSRGNGVTTHYFEDVDLAGNTVNKRSHTEILIFFNRAPIICHSKRQNTVKESTYGSDIVAMKNAVELIEALRYKLCMFKVPIDGPTNIFCDDEAVNNNCSDPTSMLNKKHDSIAYHRNHEVVAAGTCRITKEDTDTNLSDLFTKLLSQIRREYLLNKFTY